MKTVQNLSGIEKKRLATSLEKEKEKIIAEKGNTLQERKIQDKKRELARSIEQDEDNRRIQLGKAYRREGGFARFIYGLKSLAVRIPAEELYHEHLLTGLRARIRKSSRSAVLSSNDKISGKFIGKIFSVYMLANQMANILKAMFKQQKCLALYTQYAFKNLYRNIEMKRSLSDLIDLTLVLEKIQEGGDPAREYLSEQRTIIHRYVKNINSKFIAELQRDLNEFYNLYLFSEFDYKKFFISMGGNIHSLRSGYFPDCPITMNLKPNLESFHHFVSLLKGLGESSHKEVLRSILACGDLFSTEEEPRTLENITKISGKNQNIGVLTEFCKIWNREICQYPFADLIRLASLNYFYEPRSVELPKMMIKDRIKKYIEELFLDELDAYVKKTREELNADAKENLLIDYDNSMLEYYSAESIVNTGRFYGIPGFGRVDEVNIIYNFLTKYYTHHIKQVFSHLIRTVLPKNATFRTTLMNQSMAFDNLEERIRNFNSELSPDHAWGKSLINIVYRLEKNDTGNLVKQVKAQLQEIEAETEVLLQQARATFENAIQHLHAVTASENPKIRESLLGVSSNSQTTLLASIEGSIDAFHSIQTLLRSY